MTWHALLWEVALILLLALVWFHQLEIAIVSAWRSMPRDDAFVHGQG